MDKRALVVALTTGAAVFAVAGPARADTPDLYVNHAAGANCSDAGAGTASRPYCTIGAALATASAGRTITVSGDYDEHVTIDKSGEPGRPITLKNAGPGLVTLNGGPGLGFTIDGQHDIAVSGFLVRNATSGPGLAVTNSTRIAIDNFYVSIASGATAPPARLAGVTDSTLTKVGLSGSTSPVALILDAATSGVVVKSAILALAATAGAHGIEVLGSRNTILNSQFQNAGVLIGPGASGNAVVNSVVTNSRGAGIDNTGATGTAITNNTVQNNCGSGIRIAGASSGVSVQNNVVTNSGPGSSGNCGSTAGTVEIGVYDGAVGTTVVDYNSVYRGVVTLPAPDAYAWGTAMGLADFRTASGQAAHDLEGATPGTLEDSANSAAPGYQATDYLGRPRLDNPNLANTGAGSVKYADRGYRETIKGPSATLTVRIDQSALSVTADASGATPGYAPIASYTFDFGDGTAAVTQAAPVATHRYAQPGNYWVRVNVADANGLVPGTAEQYISMWPATRTVALLADNGTYVSAGADGSQQLRAGATTVGPGELFELVERDGRVALRSKANGKYVTDGFDTRRQLLAQSFTTTLEPADITSFQLVAGADGTVSLRSLANNTYVSSNSGTTKLLTDDRTAIGPWEKFHLIESGNATVSLNAHANGRYVTADLDHSGTLIANRMLVDLWEKYDLVDAGAGWVALYSHANGKFVTAESGGNAPLIANRTAIGPWEKFKVVKNADGSISLLAGVNGKYVCAENGGSSALIANRTAIGAWESFDRP
ncbi:PKD domain-containing protein [Dactylosporangium sp. NPDC049140]|uniref:PKD domain-containing protein n=1 Tax=Dactylosporangium sp. NPDC049140 TaxID=3155647 RepID=UPI0033DBCEAC